MSGIWQIYMFVGLCLKVLAIQLDHPMILSKHDSVTGTWLFLLPLRSQGMEAFSEFLMLTVFKTLLLSLLPHPHNLISLIIIIQPLEDCCSKYLISKNRTVASPMLLLKKGRVVGEGEESLLALCSALPSRMLELPLSLPLLYFSFQ